MTGLDVLITGAGGRIGSRLARALVEDGHRVRGLGLGGDPQLERLAGEIDIEVHGGDLLDRDSLRDPVSGVDVVCHLAAALTTHDAADDTFVSVNLQGTYNLLSAARDEAPGLVRFVYTSSDAVYWPAMTRKPVYLPVDEAHPLIAGSVYGATKIGAEALCRAFWQSSGMPFVVMRPTATASPAELIDPTSPFGRRWFLPAARAWLEPRVATTEDETLLEQLRAADDGVDRLLLVTDADGEASLTMITDARDVAAAMRSMIDHPDAVGEAFNVGPAAPHSDRELVDALAARLSLDVVEIRHTGVRPSWFVSSAKARGVLGYRPRWTVWDMLDEAVGREAG